MNTKSVAVILSTYNGERFLREQVDSVIKQKDVNVTLYIRDDGSSDQTPQLIKSLADQYSPYIKYSLGNNIGVSQSFFELLVLAGDADYYAFCDQDDVWDEDKLSIAINSLSDSESIASMYFCKTLPVDKNLVPIDCENKSTDFQHVFNVHEVMTRNNVIGCTLVINRNLMDLVINYIPEQVIMHDHWIYAICIGTGGKIIYDKNPHIKYRQHGANVVGNKKRMKNIFRHSSFSKTNHRIRSGMARFLLENYRNELTKENIEIISRYAYYSDSIRKRFDLVFKESKYTRNVKKRILFSIEVLLGFF